MSYDITYIQNLKGNDTSEITKQKEMHRDNFIFSRGEDGGKDS